MQNFLNYGQNPTLENLNNRIDALAAKLNTFESINIGSKKADIQLATGEQAHSSREEFIAENTDVWQEIGLKYKTWRELQWLSKAYVARNLGIAPSTLTKFENGKPCKIAKTIQAGYELLMKNQELYNSAALYKVGLNKSQEKANRLQQELDQINTMVHQQLQKFKEMAVMN